MTSKAPLTPLLLVGIFTSLFIGGTLLLAFTFFPEPRSSLVLAGITFVCWVEFLMGIMIGAFLVKSYFGNGFSGAITAILLKATTLYGLIGVITLIAFALLEHATKSYDLSGILLSIRNTKLEEAEALLRFDRLMKKLQNAEQCLSHSHGGGLADKVPDFESLDQQISKTIEKLTQSSTSLVQTGTDFSEENLQKMEEDTSSLHSLLARARLL